MIGKTISHYKILEELGRGGRGVVYKAEDLNIGRIVAIKFLHSHLKRDEEAISRFVNEAKAASALDHTNIGILYEVDTTAEGEIFIVMAYYESGTLRERIDRGEISTEEVLYIATQIASGLACAHDNGIVHRDIKPSNIILTRDKEIKIIDFGLAKLAGKTKLTKDGSTLGTAAYMSPEQARGEEVDHRSDIFSLGSILYEMISGERPFKGEHEAALLYEIVHEEPDPLMQYRSDIPQRLQEITDKALAKDVADRYQSAKELLAAIEGLDRVTSPETGIGTCKKRRVSKSGLISIIASIAAVAVVALFTLYPKFLKPVDQESASHATREIFSIVVAPFWGQNERAAEEGRVMQALHARKLSEML
jgi:serine/threonine protein kinase